MEFSLRRTVSLCVRVHDTVGRGNPPRNTKNIYIPYFYLGTCSASACSLSPSLHLALWTFVQGSFNIFPTEIRRFNHTCHADVIAQIQLGEIIEHGENSPGQKVQQSSKSVCTRTSSGLLYFNGKERKTKNELGMKSTWKKSEGYENKRRRNKLEFSTEIVIYLPYRDLIVRVVNRL